MAITPPASAVAQPIGQPAVPGPPPAQLVQEEPVVDCSPPGSFSMLSLSSASLADSANALPVLPPVPMNSPEKPNEVDKNSKLDLLSCFGPLNRFLPNIWWSSVQKKAVLDSDTESFEFILDDIDVNFKENYIGGGNQSSVFRGKLRGRWIALKKLNRASEVDIKRLCSLDHPNVIKTLGVCTKDIYPCIVMEYCEKGGLFDYLRTSPQLPKHLFLRWSVEIATGMAYLHSLNIVHRDLKSPNVLVDNTDTVKICDFGSLYTWDQRLNSHNQQQQPLVQMKSVVMSVCGTYQWMSPEMIKNEPCNEKVDVWSFGVVLWELLTGEVPYEKVAHMAVCFGVGSDRLTLHVPKMAPESVKFLLKLCWARKPRNRPSFMSILTNLNNVQSELSGMQEESWAMRRQVWRREINEAMAQLMENNSDKVNAQRQKEEELTQKRMHELRHAQEIRELYEMKLSKIDQLFGKTNRFIGRINAQKKENEQLSLRLADQLAHDAHWHQLLHEWHAGLKETAECDGEAGRAKQRDENAMAELDYFARQAEEAKKAAMFAHGLRSNTANAQNQALMGSMDSDRTTVDNGYWSGRPAVLKMTYFDDNGRTIEQRVVPQQHERQLCQPTTGTYGRNIGQRKSLPGPEQIQMASSNQRRHENAIRRANQINNNNLCQNSSSCSSAGEEGEEEGENPNEEAGGQRLIYFSGARGGNGSAGLGPTVGRGGRGGRAQRAPIGRQQGEDNNNGTMAARLDTQTSICPSEYSQISSRLSCCCPPSAADCQCCAPLPHQQHTVISTLMSAVGASLSRDDSAISSLVLFSPSDRSLQSLANNNNNGKSPSSGQLCQNCPCNVAHLPPTFQPYFFARNCMARASGFSADSGLCQEDELLTVPPSAVGSILAAAILEEDNGNILLGEGCCLAPNSCQCPDKQLIMNALQGNRNASSRQTDWSDCRAEGGIRQQLQSSRPRRRSRRPSSFVAFSRDSPLRTPSRREYAGGLRRSRSRTVGAKSDDVNSAVAMSKATDCSNSSCATLGRNMPSAGETKGAEAAMEKRRVRNRRLAELRQQSSQEEEEHWVSSPAELVHFGEQQLGEKERNGTSERQSPVGAEEKEGEAEGEEDSHAHNLLEGLTLGPIDEMTDSQLTERAMATEKAMAAAMMESSSTMVSSLERSLEMAVAYSDGLSDREAKLRQAKTTFKLTHRRTASNPTSVPTANSSCSSSASTGKKGPRARCKTTAGGGRVVESSTESEEEQRGPAEAEGGGNGGGPENSEFLC